MALWLSPSEVFRRLAAQVCVKGGVDTDAAGHARGHTMMYFINGALMSVLIDDDLARFVNHGVLAMQLEGRGDNRASFRNLWIRNFDK